ncbi:substrate-binding periplasmic protein [Alysiella filiformis]|uniref:Polar amino acid transport system substrate-binding protein n=1 Tax=Alysiella filiformis DSM 16848 TaxID=1120981 RepID=A0A286EGT3_9NEIS|nr:ABC transporter substrate-binding protein [Alysiella filiformis]QMT32167.1 amino acid ABC transporter substrate-binding protein [Alysiella filiformis]UBQ56913.1 ABC transporter substrate-binding protein [Alysiella filiformis DSM 16848]SOD70108.1 polar amino acid transport system substrate-binding protein [Alysiella filiformis DSM 16848]
MQSYLKLLTALPLMYLAACDSNTPTSTAPKASEPAPTAAASTPASDKPNYVVISQYSYPPFATRAADGSLVGMDMDLLNAIAEKQGFTLTFLPHNMSGLLENVNEGRADIVATGVNITPERLEKYEFSKPYLEGNWVALLNREKNKVGSWAELKNKAIAVQESSLSETQLKSTEITNQPLLVKTVYLGLNAVNKGDAVAVYDVDSVLNTYFKDNPNYYTVVDEKSGKIPFGFVMKKGNTELKAKLDKGIDEIQADGTYQKILDKWYPKAEGSDKNQAK